MSKKILVILGHPSKESLCASIAKAYSKGATSSGAKVKEIYISDLKFDLILHKGYRKRQHLEKDLQKSQELIKWAEHIVLIYPTWWGSTPAILKGFIDRVFLPRFAFNLNENSIFQEKLLKGKSAHLIVTSGARPILYYFIGGNPAIRHVKKTTMEFCGIKPVRITKIGPIKNPPREKINNWLKIIEKKGKKLK